MDNHVQYELQTETINGEEQILKNGSTNETGYSGSTHDDVCCSLSKALEEHQNQE